MRQTWRWFGPADTIAIGDLSQVGVEGIVSALHHFKPGEVWTMDEIKKRQCEISFTSNGLETGLAWEVVESLPVSEAIKTQTGSWREHLENYKTSLKNLSKCGIRNICYNFMPVLDWTRTQLRSRLSHGGTAMRFNLVDFAMFDLHLLKRADAHESYSTELIDRAEELYHSTDEKAQHELVQNVVAGLPGANDNWSLEDVRTQLNTYKHIDVEQLRVNLIAFLEEVIPTAKQFGMLLCCHPDDPPFSLLGLPRIMSSPEDFPD